MNLNICSRCKIRQPFGDNNCGGIRVENSRHSHLKRHNIPQRLFKKEIAFKGDGKSPDLKVNYKKLYCQNISKGNTTKISTDSNVHDP